MPYIKKRFPHLKELPGISNTILENHFTLYEGYVNNTNKLLDHCKMLTAAGQEDSPQFAEIKRRLGWEWNGMRLHELFFQNIGKEKTELNKDSGLYDKILSQFGSFENWRKDFIATASMRGIGWAVFYHDQFTGNLINSWINEHDVGHLTGAHPLIVADLFEHAYLLDYGAKRIDYLQAVMNLINWQIANERYI